ncbi:1-phosphofructokinase family hexose kinase [Cytophagaceae bacterium ABcell3]|nr:1-phosphofructokinase family hexose kinase [Cytophagaceae bacterium ABcell3]
MKKIFTLTVSPAIDKSTTIDHVYPESKLRCSEPVFEPGGGGINVSRGIKRLGGKSIAIYPQGGATGLLMEELLNRESVEQMPIETKNWNRENFIVVEEATNHQFRFGFPGPELTEEELQRFIDTATDPATGTEILVASGSLPQNAPVDFFAKLAEKAAQNNIKYVVDTSGDSLREVLKKPVFLLKPNLKELQSIVGGELRTNEEQEEGAKKLMDNYDVELLAVSLGPSGALMASRTEGIKHIPAPSVKKKSTVGAGDSMVAGMVHQISLGKSHLEAVQFGVACGTAATMNPGTELFRKHDVENLFRWISHQK